MRVQKFVMERMFAIFQKYQVHQPHVQIIWSQDKQNIHAIVVTLLLSILKDKLGSVLLTNHLVIKIYQTWQANSLMMMEMGMGMGMDHMKDW